MKIVDKNGEWFINTGIHRFNDPESNTLFEPGVPTKATATVWLKKQPVIKATDDPLAQPAPPAPTPTPPAPTPTPPAKPNQPTKSVAYIKPKAA